MDSFINSDDVISLIEKLKVKLNQPQFSKTQIENLGQIAAYSIDKVSESFSKAIAELKAAIKPNDEKISQYKSQQNVVIRKEHVFNIDFRNSKAALTMISMGIVILLSFGCNIRQLNRSCKLSYNGFKYRYIKSTNSITPENQSKLERIYKYPKDKRKLEK